MRFLCLTLIMILVGCTQAKTSEVNAGWSGENGPTLSRSETGVMVVGHVLDRNTGEPVVGARIEAPGGLTAVSNAAGYFEITGFIEGESGELKATWGEGFSARTQLRALRPGRLEVVLHLGQ